MIENPLQFFPLEKARGLQSAVIDEIDKVFRSGKKIVILEAPVGSGKSAVALTLGRAAKDCHILTPRKSLQDQYFDDFEEHIVLMKGRNSYPCTFDSTPNEYRKVINKIKGGQIAAPSINEETCATGPCRDSKSMFDKCVGLNGPCPYKVAMEVAQNNDIVVHNLHSFIFQTNFTEAFIPRELLIVDEAHEIEGIMRDFISKSFTSHKPVWTSRVPESSDPEDWREVLFSDDFVPIETASDRIKKQQDPDFTSERDNYLLKVKIFLDQLESTGHKYTIRFHENNHGRTGVHVNSTVEFVPHKIGNAAQTSLFNYGSKVLLMSATIFDKDVFCRNIGLNPEDAYFIKAPSSFPLKNRPVYLKSEYQVDTSFQQWDNNFGEMIGIIQKIMDTFHDVKGLIHAPSYAAMEQIAVALNDDRIMTHRSDNFVQRLNEFYNTQGPNVFISPVCQQGVDFKGDRGRFQIVLRVPYPSTQDKFISEKVETDFPWYNYQALVTFGQQLGRINRSETDFGVTFLMDSRFNKFVSRNNSKLPKWQRDAFIWK
jgi:ATP-dependent DNA helicase DinG